jgi:hypothetical protein
MIKIKTSAQNGTKNSNTANNTNPSQQNSNSNGNNTANVPAGKKHCDYCGKVNHTEDNCIKKLKEQLQRLPQITSNTSNVVLLCYDTCMFISQGDSLVKQNTFIADSGASTHMVHSKQFLTDFQPRSYTFLSVCALAQCKDVLIKENYGVPDHMDVLD